MEFPSRSAPKWWSWTRGNGSKLETCPHASKARSMNIELHTKPLNTLEIEVPIRKPTVGRIEPFHVILLALGVVTEVAILDVRISITSSSAQDYSSSIALSEYPIWNQLLIIPFQLSIMHIIIAFLSVSNGPGIIL